MANYQNDAAFARGFDALSGLLNMFLQNRINRRNVQDNRDYQDETYEKRLQDTIATNMYNNAVKGNGDLYRPIPKQTVAGHEFDSVANNPTGNVDTNDFQKLRNGELSYKMRPNMDSNLGNNYRVKLDTNSARLLNRVYRTNYNVGDVVPYSLFSGVSAMSNTQDRINNTGNITPKVAITELNKIMKAYDPTGFKSDDDKLVYIIEDPIANGLLQKTGLYKDALQKYADIKSKNSNPVENQENEDSIFTKLFGLFKKNKENNPQVSVQQQNKNYKIMQDASGNRAKVYEDGTIEEI